MRKYQLWIGMSVMLFLVTGCQALMPPNEPITWAWSYRAGDYIRSQPTVNGEVVYIGADDNKMHAVDISTGEVLWTSETADNVTSSAVTDDDRVYFGSWDGTIYALDTTGETLWTFQTGDWVSATPLLHDGVLYVGSHDRTFYALDANTGELIWRYVVNGRIEERAIVAGDLVLFNSSDGYVHAIDPDDGQRRWFYYMDGAMDSPPILSDGQVYVAALGRTLHALDSAHGDLLWTYRASAPIGTTPVADRNVVYIGADDGTVTALAGDSGAPVWQQGLGEMIRSTPAVWNGLLFVGTNDGNLYALDTRSGALAWRYRLGGAIVQGPTIIDDKLYIGSTTSQLQAFELDVDQLSQLLDVPVSTPGQLHPLEPKAAATFHAERSVQTPSIIEYHRLWRADAAMPDIDANRALHDVINFRPRSPAAYLAHVGLARFYAEQEDPVAVDHYRAALVLDGPVALHLELANLLEAQGDGPAAYEEYRSVLRRKPDAFEGMRRTGTDPLQVAADLNQALYYTDALETLRDVNDSGAAPLRAEAYLGLGRYAEAATAYRSMIRSDPANESARMGLALAQAWLGDGDSALDLYSTIDSVESQRRQAQLLTDDEPEQALSLYLEADVPSAWWSATALLESQDRLTETLPIYEYLAESDSPYADDAAYRLIVLGQRLNNTEAVTEGQRLLEQQGLNWLALRNSADALKVEALPALALDRSLMRKVDALDALGRNDLAELELIYAGRISNKPEVILAIADALSERGKVLESQSIAERYVATNILAPLEFWELSYPRPYASLVMEAGAEFGVDPLLVWAVMREESRFDPDALSHAGARGLMQVIPSTQSWIAEKLGETQAPGDAYIPATSIRMGAWLLDFLTGYFDGDLELAIPAYNAGAGSVESWQADPRVASRDDLLRWIGYNETRLYLKRVALSYQVYRALYGSE